MYIPSIKSVSFLASYNNNKYHKVPPTRCIKYREPGKKQRKYQHKNWQGVKDNLQHQQLKAQLNSFIFNLLLKARIERAFPVFDRRDFHCLGDAIDV